MKYSEFKRLLKQRDYVAVMDDNHVMVRDKTNHDKSGCNVISISRGTAYIIDTNYYEFSVLPHNVRSMLFRLATQLAGTPLNEREDEKRYRLKLPFVRDSGYLTNARASGNYYISNEVETSHYQVIFTESEVEELKQNYNLDSFVMEEVKEDE